MSGVGFKRWVAGTAAALAATGVTAAGCTATSGTPAPDAPRPAGSSSSATPAATPPQTPPPAAKPQALQPFRLMTYNVRRVTPDDTGRYTWDNRKKNVVRIIRANDPDVFGVQEASGKIPDELVLAFQDTHHVFRTSNGSPKLVFFRKGMFERVPGPDSGGLLEFPNPYEKGDACRKNASGRTASWVKLRQVATGQELLVVNLHPSHGADCDEAREQAARVVRAFLGEKAAGLDILVFGDTNTDPKLEALAGDDSLEILERGGTPRLSRPDTDGPRRADEATFNADWKKPRDKNVRLDFFLLGPGLEARGERIDRRKLDGITPSDHFPVSIEVVPAKRQG